MSLKDPDEEYDELVPEKRKGRAGKAASKLKLFGIVLVIGIIIGVFLGHYYVEPIIDEMQSSTCKDCLATKELLSKENDCLYKMIPDAQGALEQCSVVAPEKLENEDPVVPDNNDLLTDNNNP